MPAGGARRSGSALRGARRRDVPHDSRVHGRAARTRRASRRCTVVWLIARRRAIARLATPWRLRRWTSAQSCTPNTSSSSGRRIEPSIGRNLGFAPEDRPEVSSLQPTSTVSPRLRSRAERRPVAVDWRRRPTRGRMRPGISTPLSVLESYFCSMFFSTSLHRARDSTLFPRRRRSPSRTPS